MPKKLLVFILAISPILLFLNLGDRFVWTDEAETAVLAQNILSHGYPTTKGEYNTLWIWPDGNKQYGVYNYPAINDYEIEIRPWLPVYIAATFFYLFGDSFFVLRFPFALAGFLTLIFLYLFVKKAAQDSKLAVFSVFLLSLFVPFYLYSRIGRYYPLMCLFTLFVLISYLKVLDKKKFGMLSFILSSILLFYTLPSALLGVYGGLVIHLILFKFNISVLIKRFIPATLIISLAALPWLVFVNYNGMSDFSLAASFAGLVNLIAYIFLYIFPFIFVIGLPLVIISKKAKFGLDSFFCCVLLVVLFSILAPVLQPWGEQIPFRYIPHLFPLFMVLIAGIILKIASFSRFIAAIAVFFLVFTNFLYVFPFKLAENLLLDNLVSDETKLFVADNLKFRYFLRDFIYEITHHYSTPNEKIVNFIKSNGAKSTDVLLTNYDLNVMLYASGMRLYQKGIVDEKPDWIVLRKPASYPEPEPYVYARQFITPEYERFVLTVSDYRYQRDEPHPRTHRFRELDKPIVSLQYPHEVDFIEIYKLRD